MLVLCRQLDETIVIGDRIEVTVVEISGGKVRLGITAPPEIRVHRKEVWEQIQRQKQAGVQPVPATEKTQSSTASPGPAEPAKSQAAAEAKRPSAGPPATAEPSCNVGPPRPPK